MKNQLSSAREQANYSHVSTLVAGICCVISGLLGYFASHIAKSNNPTPQLSHSIEVIATNTQQHSVSLALEEPVPLPIPKPAPPPERQISPPKEEVASPVEDRLTQKHIESTLEQESRDYMPLFTELGLDEAQIRQLLQDISRLHLGASRVNSETIRLARERNQYDKKLKSLLEPDAYEKYKAFESKKGVRTEVSEMGSYFAERHFVPTESAIQSIQTALEHFPAITTETWHGPYDPIPRPLMGKEVISRMDELIAGAENQLPGLTTELSQSLSQEELVHVAGYYSNRIGYFRSVIEQVNEPPRTPETEQKEQLEKLEQIRRLKSGLKPSP